VTRITDLDAREATSKQAYRNGSASVLAGNHYLHDEILAHLPRIERFARALTHDVVSADDLVQDCLARALEKIHLWEPGTDLRAWLFTILYRQHISHTRRDARHRVGVELQESDASLVFPANQTARLELRDLERGLVKLPEEQRSTLLHGSAAGRSQPSASTFI